MVCSIHLADIGVARTLSALRRRPRPSRVPGLLWADAMVAASLGAGLPRPRPGRVALLSAWSDDAALDRFLATNALPKALAGGWSLRLEPLRGFGSWSPLPDFPTASAPVADDEPVAVVTLGRVKPARLAAFVRAQGPAAEQAAHHPAVLMGTALARPPVVSTFSLWRDAASMRSFAYGDGKTEHMGAIKADREKPFHRESLFARFRPYAERGTWQGAAPLAGVQA